MDEIGANDEFAQGEVTTSEWMLPTAALDRFEPPRQTVIAAAVKKEVGRYGFKIGSLGMLIQLGCGSEVMQIPTIWSLPGAPPWFLGLINLRGNLVPLYELRTILGLGARASEEKPLVLVFDQGEKAVGILIDDFPKPLAGLSQLAHLPQLPTSLTGHVRVGYVKDEMIWLEFDQNSFFDELTRNVG